LLISAGAQEIVIPAGIAGIQASGMIRSSPAMALDTRFHAGMTHR
jgi:hypothetical protein